MVATEASNSLTAMQSRDRIAILGVLIDRLDAAAALQRMADFVIASPAPRVSGGETLRQVVTVNPEFVMIARTDPSFRRVINQADLAVPDGIGLIWASRLLSQPLPERITGVDSVRSLAAVGARVGWRFFFLGAAPGVAEAAAQRLVADYPGLVIAGCYSGTPDAAEDEQTCRLIAQAKPDVLFVAFGAPQQDLWIDRNRERLPVALAMGVGGAFDFISGRAARAPRLFQALGLEWLHRLAKEPWRWRRMVRLPRFALLVLLARLRGESEN